MYVYCVFYRCNGSNVCLTREQTKEMGNHSIISLYCNCSFVVHHEISLLHSKRIQWCCWHVHLHCSFCCVLVVFSVSEKIVMLSNDWIVSCDGCLSDCVWIDGKWLCFVSSNHSDNIVCLFDITTHHNQNALFHHIPQSCLYCYFTYHSVRLFDSLSSCKHPLYLLDLVFITSSRCRSRRRTIENVWTILSNGEWSES